MPDFPDRIKQFINAAKDKYTFADEATLAKFAAKLLPYIREMHIDKGDILLHLGDVPGRLIFVNAGFLRKCYFDHEGSFKTHLFWTENTLFSEGIMLGKNSSEYMIDALEDTDISYIYLDDFERFLYDDLNMMKAYIKFSEHEWINFITEGLRFNVNAADRYRRFLEKYPSAENRISQQDIANYLGITPVSFSRLKKQVAKG